MRPRRRAIRRTRRTTRPGTRRRRAQEFRSGPTSSTRTSRSVLRLSSRSSSSRRRPARASSPGGPERYPLRPAAGVVLPSALSTAQAGPRLVGERRSRGFTDGDRRRLAAAAVLRPQERAHDHSSPDGGRVTQRGTRRVGASHRIGGARGAGDDRRPGVQPALELDRAVRPRALSTPAVRDLPRHRRTKAAGEEGRRARRARSHRSRIETLDGMVAQLHRRSRALPRRFQDAGLRSTDAHPSRDRGDHSLPHDASRRERRDSQA